MFFLRLETFFIYFFPLLAHKFENYRLQPISDLVIFFFMLSHFTYSTFFCLIELRFVHTAGAVPPPCFSLREQFFHTAREGAGTSFLKCN